MSEVLGIDCGSSSIKMVVLNKDKKILNSIYQKNKGVIETVKEALQQIKGNYNITSVGCTGSGREFVKILVGGDIDKTEILAHAIATLNYYPNVKTICDVGAEDSKIIIVEEGTIYNFAMNTICSAGCGAMLESIATRIGIKIQDVGDMAVQSTNQINIPAKCGVFAQSAVVTMLNKGVEKTDILMGVCSGLIRNYLMLAKSFEIKPPIVFQGMTAKNKALVKAMEEQLNNKIIVPKNCELMGAIGIALMAMENKPVKSRFKGFNLIQEDLKINNFVCKDCPNHCDITQIIQKEKPIGAIGSRCKKW